MKIASLRQLWSGQLNTLQAAIFSIFMNFAYMTRLLQLLQEDDSRYRDFPGKCAIFNQHRYLLRYLAHLMLT